MRVFPSYVLFVTLNNIFERFTSILHKENRNMVKFYKGLMLFIVTLKYWSHLHSISLVFTPSRRIHSCILLCEVLFSK